MADEWPFGSLVPLSYDFIMADPPWLFKNYSEAGEWKNAQRYYRCLPLDEIKAFPVGHLARGDCALWLWARAPMVEQAYDVMRAWGFTPKTMGWWRKVTASGKQPMGTGYIFRSAGDPVIIGTVGSPRFANNIRNTFDGVRREHTRKPEEAFAVAERLCPGVRRCELFSWTDRPGWETWGDETGKYDMVKGLIGGAAGTTGPGDASAGRGPTGGGS